MTLATCCTVFSINARSRPTTEERRRVLRWMTATFVLFLFTAFFGVCTVSAWRQYHEARLDARGRGELHSALRSHLSMSCYGEEDWRAIMSHAKACEAKFRAALGKGSIPAKLYLEALCAANVLEASVSEPDGRRVAPRSGRIRERHWVADLERMASLNDGDACLALSVERMLGISSPGGFGEAMPWAERALELDAPGAEAWWENIMAIECRRQQRRLAAAVMRYMVQNNLADFRDAVESAGGPCDWQQTLFGTLENGRDVPACPAGGELWLAGGQYYRPRTGPIVCSFDAKYARHYFPKSSREEWTYFGPVPMVNE